MVIKYAYMNKVNANQKSNNTDYVWFFFWGENECTKFLATSSSCTSIWITFYSHSDLVDDAENFCRTKFFFQRDPKRNMQKKNKKTSENKDFFYTCHIVKIKIIKNN